MFCIKCGKEIPENAKFCGHCGAWQTTSNHTDPTPERRNDISETGRNNQPKSRRESSIKRMIPLFLLVIAGVGVLVFGKKTITERAKWSQLESSDSGTVKNMIETPVHENVSVKWGDGNIPENDIVTGEESVHVKVVGAERVKEWEGEGDVLRIYYEFTNGFKDGIEYASYYGVRKLVQDGKEYEQTIGGPTEYQDDFLEGPGIHGIWFNNSWTYIYPGVTIMTYEEFLYNPQGGELQVHFLDDQLVVSFDPANLPGPPQTTSEIAKIEDPQLTKEMPTEGVLEDDGKYEVKITGAEVVQAGECREPGESQRAGYDLTPFDDSINPSNTVAVLRVYFDYTNKNFFTEKDLMAGGDIMAFQDGVELPYGYPLNEVDSDRIYTVKPRQTVQLSRCYALRSDSPVEIVFGYYDDNPVGIRID